jgi:hypothetical protein
LLLSWDGEQVYGVLDALLDAVRDGRIDPGMLQQSARRLESSTFGRLSK